MKIEVSNRCMICGNDFPIKNGVMGTLVFDLGDEDVGVPPYFALVCKDCVKDSLEVSEDNCKEIDNRYNEDPNAYGTIEKF